MYIYTLPDTNPCRNLAIEECLLRSRNDDILLLWRNDNTIVVGRNQNTLTEINAPFVEANAIRVVRRISGGGAVYHDLSNVNFSFLTTLGPEGEARMERFTEPVAAALRRLGVPAERSGRNDILADGRKISGNAQALWRQRLLHHGTLLFHVNGEILEQALAVKPEKLRSKAISSVRARVSNISDFLPAGTSVEMFMEALLRELSPRGEAGELVFSPAEAALLHELEAKYASWDWVFGKNPAFSFSRTEKFPGGILEVMLDVRHGHIKGCAIYGDFMSLRDVAPVCKALLGIRHRREDIQAVLAQFALPEYFGTLTRDEIVSCMFPECGEK